MILVTQGHEKGVGVEVFLKSVSIAPASWFGQLTLFAQKAVIGRNIRALQLSAEVTAEGIRFPHGLLRCVWIGSSKVLPPSSVAMEEALLGTELVSDPVLFTLPTTKEDLRNPKKPKQLYLGHTEYLRALYGMPDLGMYFTSDDLNVLLLTDHLPLRQVAQTITPVFFRSKMTRSLSYLKKIEPDLRRVLLGGLNPHAGEGGLLGKEEQRLSGALQKLRADFKTHKITGFHPGDTLFNQRESSRDLIVYMHHDQGLGAFKALKGTLGANVTLGLPFLRISVDHGTAFTLYGKNSADYRGAYYCLRKAMVYRERLIGKDSSHQSKSSQS